MLGIRTAVQAGPAKELTSSSREENTSWALVIQGAQCIEFPNVE